MLPCARCNFLYARLSLRARTTCGQTNDVKIHQSLLSGIEDGWPSTLSRSKNGYVSDRQWLESVVEQFDADRWTPLDWLIIDRRYLAAIYSAKSMSGALCNDILDLEREFLAHQQYLPREGTRVGSPPNVTWFLLEDPTAPMGSGQGNGTSRIPISVVTPVRTSSEWATIFEW